MKIISCVLLCIFLFFGCCKKKANKGISITVLDQASKNPIEGVNVYIHDVQHSDSGPLVDEGYTDSNGSIHLKLSEKCSHYLDISCSGNSNYYGDKYQGSTHTTRSLPKEIEILLQHK